MAAFQNDPVQNDIQLRADWNGHQWKIPWGFMEQLKNLGISFFSVIEKKSVVRILEKYVKLYLTKEIVGNAYIF